MSNNCNTKYIQFWMSTLPKYQFGFYQLESTNETPSVGLVGYKSGEFGETLSETTPSEAPKGIGFGERVTVTRVSPNNNPSQERPTCVAMQDDMTCSAWRHAEV